MEKKQRKQVTVFEYFVLYTDENEAKEVLSGTLFAENERIALMKISRDIPAEYVDKLDNVDILIRNF